MCVFFFLLHHPRDNIFPFDIPDMSFLMPLANAAMGTVATKATNNVISRTHAALTGSKKKRSRSRSPRSKLMRSSVKKSPRTKTITRTYSTMSKSKRGRRGQRRR